MPLLILDRDGVINEDSDTYVRNLEQWLPIPGSIEAIAKLSLAGFTIAVATNQSGLARGYFSLDDMTEIHRELNRLVEERGGKIAGVFYCPHLPGSGCNCRKPATGLLQAIERDLNVSAAGAYFVGDSLKDLQAAQRYGCLPVLVETGKGRQTLASIRGPHPEINGPENISVYADLAAAGDAILATSTL
ncbi:MAG: D-glycero-D-manno-heptose 1,7-bisphosphate phosphatase [Halioglobus sp.]|jgi:D-glycero-D-manno-heptose 1,7-bisphosphate phosphatase